MRSNVVPIGLPDGWVPKQLCQVSDIFGGGRLGLSKSDYIAGGVMAFSAAGPDGFVSQAEGRAPSIVLSSIGARCGKSFLTHGPWATLANTQVITPREGVADARFLHSILNDETYWNRSGSAQPFIKPSDVKNAWVPLPPLDEQLRIATVLRAMDELILTQEKVFAAVQSMYTQVGRALLPDPEQEAHGGVRVHALLDVSRPRQHAIFSTKQLLQSGYPVFGANGQIGFADKYTHEQPVIAVTCRGATCGTVNWVPAKSYVSGNAMAIDELRRDVIDERYLFHFLKSWGVDKSISGSAQPQITRQSLSCVNILAPALPDQRRWAGVMDATLTAALEDQGVLDGLIQTKAMLSADLLSGRVRVPV